MRRGLESQTRPRLLRGEAIALFLLLLSLLGCRRSVMIEEEIDEERPSRAVVEEQVATFESGSSLDTGFARVGRTRVALIGERVRELQDGQRYKLALRIDDGQIDGVSVRTLLDYRKVLRLVGTLTDDEGDPTLLHLRSINEKGYGLTGPTVASYKEIRAGLPVHDYSKTLFRVSAVQQHASTLFEWVDYAPVPIYRCADRSASTVHLDLISVRRDDGLLDGFVETQIGNESRMGARASCTRDGAAYACALDKLDASWGSARFVPGAGTAGRFELVVERADDAHTRVTFACETTDRASLTSETDDR